MTDSVIEPAFYCGSFAHRLRTEAINRVAARIVVEPSVEPLTLAEARDHLRVDAFGSPPESADDAWITAQIPAARAWCEQYLGRSIARQTLEVALGGFPAGTIELPFGPVQSVDAVSYIDGDGVSQAVAGFQFDAFGDRLLFAYGEAWPTARRSLNSVRVRYTAGYIAAGDSPSEATLPGPIRSAMLLVLGHLYENREEASPVKLEAIPMGAKCLLMPYLNRLQFA